MIIVIVAPPFAGKSFLCKEFVEKFKNWVTINQTELGGLRRRCIQAAKATLADGKSVLIDRCNISVEQRKYWIDIGKEFDIPVDCIELTRTRKEFKEIMKQVTHEVGQVLQSPAANNAERLNQFLAEYQAPTLDEGFSKVICIKTNKFITAVSFNPLIVGVSCSLWPYLRYRLTIKPFWIQKPPISCESSHDKKIKPESTSGKKEQTKTEWTVVRSVSSARRRDSPSHLQTKTTPTKKHLDSTPLDELFSGLQIEPAPKAKVKPSKPKNSNLLLQLSTAEKPPRKPKQILLP
ncbi:hypothetical protein DSO57_1036089 [Entomophthora muscae]|uniref:Uncharacterized protein n=1 Tax=Entomophthora muscae TaxID=34485 RepID=A0ACC2TAD0_9FUNG|nr:hypothetical protein DSO57_1036089 [Entomophthora muscae]